mgnify:CR=1 FL=1
MSDESVDTTALETVHFLSGSAYRYEILRAFVEQHSLTRQAVRERVDASRSTVRRTLEAFVGRGLIESVEGGYRLTATGEALAEGVGSVLELARITDEYEPLLRRLEPAVHGLDPTWLDGASMTVSTETNPFGPAQRQTQTVREATTFRGFLPAIEIEGAKLVHERITAGQLQAEIVVPSAMRETLTSQPFASLFRDQLDTERFECHIAPDGVPFYLGLADDETTEIGVADVDNIPRVLVQSTDTALRAWGDRVFEQYRRSATRLDEIDR